jgi:hypothetical protein
MGNNARVDQNAADEALANGLAQNAKAVGTLTVGGNAMKPTDVQKVLQGRIAARNKATQARLDLKAAVAAQKSEIANTRGVVTGVKQALKVMFSNDASLLGTFGLVINAHEPTVATKAAGAVKAQVTRAAHGIKGKKQRQAMTAPAAAPAVAATATPAAAPGPVTPAKQ